jgi:hypothetical protein
LEDPPEIPMLSFQVLKKRATTELLRPKTSPATVEFAFGSQVRVPGSQDHPGSLGPGVHQTQGQNGGHKMLSKQGFLNLSGDERAAEPAITSYLFWSWHVLAKCTQKLLGSSHCIPAAAETS